MYCTRTVVFVCLLAFAECNNLLQQFIPCCSGPSAELQHKEPNFIRTQTTYKPPCVKCVIPQKNELVELAKAIQDAIPVLKNASEEIGSVFMNVLTNFTNTDLAIQKSVADLTVDIEPVLDKLCKSVANIKNCPSLKALFDTLRLNIIAFVDVLTKTWPLLLTETDLASLTDSFVEALSNLVTTGFPIFRDLFYYLLQLFGFNLCDSLGNYVYDLLDPYGDLANKIIELLKSASKSEKQISTILPVLITDAVPGLSPQTLNVFTVPSQALCILVSGLDLGGMIGKCPTEPPGGSSNPLAAVIRLTCSVLILVLAIPGLSNISDVPLPSLPGICKTTVQYL